VTSRDTLARLTEIAEILAAGLMRLQALKSSLISPDNGDTSFAEAALQYYDADDGDGEMQNRIETAIRRSSTETGGWGDGPLCAYHNEQASKDD
jgi:hypothetical protein